MNGFNDCLLDICDLSGSHLVDKGLHLSLADLTIVINVEGGENRVELFFWESVLLTYLSQVGCHEALHFTH